MLTRPALIAVVAVAAVMLAGCPADDPNDDGCPHANDTRATASTCWHPNANGDRVYHPG